MGSSARGRVGEREGRGTIMQSGSHRAFAASAFAVFVLVVSPRESRGDEILSLHPPGWLAIETPPEARGLEPAARSERSTLDEKSIVLDLAALARLARLDSGFVGAVLP